MLDRPDGRRGVYFVRNADGNFSSPEAAGGHNVTTQWQYRVKFIKVPRTEATAIVSGELNELGEDGWELVNVVDVGGILMAVFKRPVA
jgi:hypothetical protein